MEACDALDVLIVSLQRAMIAQAAKLERAVMPAYTHLQRAQPVSGAHWMLSHFWPLQRDRERLAAARASRGVASARLGRDRRIGVSDRARAPREIARLRVDLAEQHRRRRRSRFHRRSAVHARAGRRASFAPRRRSDSVRLERVRVRALRRRVLDRLVDDAAEAKSRRARTRARIERAHARRSRRAARDDQRTAERLQQGFAGRQTHAVRCGRTA